MADLLLGKPVADALVEKIRTGADLLASRGPRPRLAVLRVGDRPDDISYERGLFKRAEACGVEVASFTFAQDATENDMAQVIERINADNAFHGCLMFRPLPKTMDEEFLSNLLVPTKDVDGMTRNSLAMLMEGRGAGFAPCTAAAVLEICDFYNVPLEGAKVCVVGRSLVIGKPVAQLLLARNATVTQCHSRTVDVPGAMRAADVVVVATGRAKAYGADCFREGQVVIDVGINVDAEGKLCGDVDFDAVEPIVSAITPVPRGVGSVTTSVLMKHVVERAATLEKLAQD